MDGSNLFHSQQQHPTLLVFGPQALNFDIVAFQKLRTQLNEEAQHRWTLDVVRELPSLWETASKKISLFQNEDGKQQLEELSAALDNGELPLSSFPLSNILLNPLVVIAQLTQYQDFLNAAFPELKETDKFPASLASNIETLGLCTGTLGAFAVASSSTLQELSINGKTAVRLAMLLGALVDTEESSPTSDGKLLSFSVSWISVKSDDVLTSILQEFDE
ncbi:hypothetical protein F66182_11278, partial [Fusarium sp. NRRL 66182]